MHKEDFLKLVAQKGYDVGFGAKKHFATYDIVEKIPNWIAFITLSVGIIQVAYPEFKFSRELSILLIIIGFTVFYINSYSSEKEKYMQAGIKLTKIFNGLKEIYYKAKSSIQTTSEMEDEFRNLLNEYYSTSITKQVFLSDWYSHFKFFYEMQIDWIDEQIHFRFWKDKIPKSFIAFSVSLLILIIVIGILIWK